MRRTGSGHLISRSVVMLHAGLACRIVYLCGGGSGERSSARDWRRQYNILEKTGFSHKLQNTHIKRNIGKWKKTDEMKKKIRKLASLQHCTLNLSKTPKLMYLFYTSGFHHQDAGVLPKCHCTSLIRKLFRSSAIACVIYYIIWI